MAHHTRHQTTRTTQTMWPNWIDRAALWIIGTLIILVPLFFLTVNEELFEFNKMLLTYALTTILGSLWGIKMIGARKLIWRNTPLDWAWAIWIGSQILSTLLSMHPQTSIFGYYTRFHGGLLSTITYALMFYSVVNLVKRSYLPKILTMMLVSAAAVTLYAIPEHFGHSLSCVFITGNYDVQCWVQDVQTRVFGTFGQPNWLAAYAAMVLPISIVTLLTTPENSRSSALGKVAKLAPLISTVLLTLTLIFTKSRSGFLAFGASIGLLSICGVWIVTRAKQDVQSVRPLMHRVVGLSVAILLSIAIFGTPFTPQLSKLIAQPQTQQQAPVESQVVNRLEQGGTDSGEIRKIVWEGAIDIWKANPLFGSGVETFAYSYFQHRPLAHNLVSEWDFLYNKAHNELLNILATTGAVGLGAYILLHLAISIMFVRTIFTSNDATAAWRASALLAGMIAAHVSNFFGFSTVTIGILMTLFPAIGVILAAPASEDSSPSTRWTGGQYVAAAGVILVALYLMSMIWIMWFSDVLYARAKALHGQRITDQADITIQQAITLSPTQAVFHELQAQIAAERAVRFAQSQDLSAATLAATRALDASDQTLLLNPVHLNLYKSRMQVFLTLAQLQPEFYTSALETLTLARTLSPTDPKLVYNAGVITQATGDTTAAIQLIEEAVSMKPNYEAARYQLGQLYELTNQPQRALEQYEYILEHLSPSNETVIQRATAVATVSASPAKTPRLP